MVDEVYLGPHAMFLIEGSQFTAVIYMAKSRFGTIGLRSVFSIEGILE